MGELYDIRSAVEHLHENRYLEYFDRAIRLDIAKKEAIVEHIARTALARVIGDDTLWPHFANTPALEKFWALTPPERKKIWGDPIDPLAAIADFDPKYASGPSRFYGPDPALGCTPSRWRVSAIR